MFMERKESVKSKEKSSQKTEVFLSKATKKKMVEKRIRK